MIQSVDMNETAGMLEARLRLIDRIRRVEHMLAREEQAKIAAALMKGRSHDLGNHLQIVKLSALELERRAQDRTDLVELTADMRQAAEQAATLLADMFAAARPAARTEVGPVVTHTVRAAVDLARPAFAGTVELRIDLDDTVHTHSTAEELEAIVLAAMLDAVHASRVAMVVRERVISGKRWVEILRVDDRQHFNDGELAQMFEACSLLHVVVTAAKLAGGEASLAPGRGGLELAIELPVATKPLR
jgi:nitrogen-specific signal transduction histidine kinase